MTDDRVMAMWVMAMRVMARQPASGSVGIEQEDDE